MRAHRGQATHPQCKPVGGLCEVRACDHRSPTTAYGLTRFACRAAVFVGVDTCKTRTSTARPSERPACLPPCAKAQRLQLRGIGPRPRGGAQKRAVRPDTRPQSRHPSLSADDGDEGGHAVRVAAPALAHRNPQDAAACSRRRSYWIAVIPAHTCRLRHEAPGLCWIQDVGHGASG